MSLNSGYIFLGVFSFRRHKIFISVWQENLSSFKFFRIKLDRKIIWEFFSRNWLKEKEWINILPLRNIFHSWKRMFQETALNLETFFTKRENQLPKPLFNDSPKETQRVGAGPESQGRRKSKLLWKESGATNHNLGTQKEPNHLPLK